MPNVSYTVNLVPCSTKTISEIGEIWQELSSRVDDANYFLSWPWIESWLMTCCPTVMDRCYLIIAERTRQVCGLGIVVHDAKHYRTGYLHKAGNDALDQIWLEYNDFLLQADDREAIRDAMLTSVMTSPLLKIQALTLDMTLLSADTLDNVGLPFQTLSSIGYKKDITGRATSEMLLQDFSKNTRQQITRSLKRLSQQGRVGLKVCREPQEKLSALPEIRRLHQEQWRANEWGSGFDNGVFDQFHQRLLEHASTQVIMLEIDDKPLAYGYYFCFNKQVLFYLSAMIKSADNRTKVGLSFHALAMTHFAKFGYQSYDFLAGDARYKASLSDTKYELKSYRIYRQNWFNKAVVLLRNIKFRLTH